MSHSRGEKDAYHDARKRALNTAEIRVADVDHALACLKDVARILQRNDLSEFRVVQVALERVGFGVEDLGERLEKAIKARGHERRRTKEGKAHGDDAGIRRDGDHDRLPVLRPHSGR